MGLMSTAFLDVFGSLCEFDLSHGHLYYFRDTFEKKEHTNKLLVFICLQPGDPNTHAWRQLAHSCAVGRRNPAERSEL